MVLSLVPSTIPAHPGFPLPSRSSPAAARRPHSSISRRCQTRPSRSAQKARVVRMGLPWYRKNSAPIWSATPCVMVLPRVDGAVATSPSISSTTGALSTCSVAALTVSLNRLSVTTPRMSVLASGLQMLRPYVSGLVMASAMVPLYSRSVARSTSSSKSSSSNSSITSPVISSKERRYSASASTNGSSIIVALASAIICSTMVMLEAVLRMRPPGPVWSRAASAARRLAMRPCSAVSASSKALALPWPISCARRMLTIRGCCWP